MIFLRKEWTQMDRSRRAATALIVSLALYLALPLAAAREAPASSQQRLAELQRLENDPQVKRAGEAWNKASREAIRQHLRAVAAQGDPRSLLAASMLWSGFGHLEDNAQPLRAKPAQETRAWFDAARRARPRDVLVAWIEASDCKGLSDSCNAREALQFLLQAEPQNAAVQMLAVAAAGKRGDGKAIDGFWQAIAAASIHDAHTLEIGQLLHATMADIDLPPLDPRLAQAMGLQFGLNRPATAQDFAEVSVIGIWMAQAMPGFSPVTHECKGEKLASASLNRQAECERVLELLSADESTLFGPMIGLSKLVELSGDSAEGKAWREQLRQFYWIYENAQQHMMGMAPSDPLPAEYGAWFMTEGELPAMRKLLAHYGLPIRAPAGWLPREPRYRALVSTGREAASAE
jgi:hypothetical protein